MFALVVGEIGSGALQVELRAPDAALREVVDVGRAYGGGASRGSPYRRMIRAASPERAGSGRIQRLKLSTARELTGVKTTAASTSPGRTVIAL